MPAPEGVHGDGHDFLAIHLIRRHNITGGDNLIHKADGALMETINLRERLDTLILDDRAIQHDVTPIMAGEKESCGWRDTLIIDFDRLSAMP